MAMLLSLFHTVFPSVQRIILPSLGEWVDFKVPEESWNLIDIYDFSLDGQPEAKQVLKHQDCKSPQDDLHNLPKQGKSCRVYLMATCHTGQQKIVGDHLRTLVADVNQHHEKGFDSLASQWSKTRRQARHSLDFFARAPTQSLGRIEKLARSSRLQGASQLMTGVMRVTPSIGCHLTENDALIVVIELQASRSKLSKRHDEWLLEFFTQYVQTFLGQNEEQRHCQKSDLSQELRIQLYLLRFYTTYLRLYKDFLTHVEHHDREQSYIVDPRYSTLQPSALTDIIESAYHYNIFLDMATANSVMVGSLMSVMRATWTEPPDTELRRLLAEIEATSDWLPKPFAQLTSRMSRHIELANLSRSTQESMNSRTLNLLACIFLPMSLATSLLSMSTRFTDLGPLLYDFCGVIVLFASLLVLVFLMLKIYQWLENMTKLARRHRFLASKIYEILFWLGLAVVWPVVLSSFIVGMVVDISLGFQILGYGLAGLVGLNLLYFLWTALAICFD